MFNALFGWKQVLPLVTQGQRPPVMRKNPFSQPEDQHKSKSCKKCDMPETWSWNTNLKTYKSPALDVVALTLCSLSSFQKRVTLSLFCPLSSLLLTPGRTPRLLKVLRHWVQRGYGKLGVRHSLEEWLTPWWGLRSSGPRIKVNMPRAPERIGPMKKWGSILIGVWGSGDVWGSKESHGEGGRSVATDNH